jgi:hypothetical protein
MYSHCQYCEEGMQIAEISLLSCVQNVQTLSEEYKRGFKSNSTVRTSRKMIPKM